MEYKGIQSQIWRNNTLSALILAGFPILVFFLTAIGIFFSVDKDIEVTLEAIPVVFMVVGGGVLLWFIIAYFSHTSMITKATGALPLERKENMRVYNLVENLCISRGIKTPKIYIILDSSLNAYASGINERTYSITLSQGIIEKLSDEELEAVIAHELTHIMNRDVRLLIVSIVFVGIFSFLAQAMLRSMGRAKGKKGGQQIVVVLILALIGLLISYLLRFALSRKREYMADAGAAQLTKNPLALASALEKVSQDSQIEAISREDVAQLFIHHPLGEEKGFFSFLSGVFKTHPPIEERIAILRQY